MSSSSPTDPILSIQDLVLKVLEAETTDLRKLARIARRDPKTFYRYANLRDVDLSDQDIFALDLTFADTSRAKMPTRMKHPPRRAKSFTKRPLQGVRSYLDALRKAEKLVAKILQSSKTDILRAIQTTQAEWYERAQSKGRTFDIAVAMHLAEFSLKYASSAADRGYALYALATALAKLGEREPGTARLDAAVLAYTEASKERTRDRVPLDWATTQMNLGNALLILGEREPGTARLDAAVQAYTEALKEFTRDRVPQDWALTQMNLGSALLSLGERESGTARLEAAVLAFSEALKEFTRDRVPLDWARTQMNIGNALAALGEREPGTARLEAAVLAFTEALKEFTRDRVPLQWAMVQFNLANVEIAYFYKTANPFHLAFARTHVLAAREVFVVAQAEHYVQLADALLAEIAARTAQVRLQTDSPQTLPNP